MSWASERADQRRADQVAAAEQARLDAQAQLERQLKAHAVRAELAAQDQARRDAGRAEAAEQARARRAAAAERARAWVSTHRVDLLIYPLALASAVLAVPSMAAFGIQVYGGPAGAVLPVLTELGMWAFALAVQARRRATPGASVWALQVGVWTFAAVAFALNVLHGLALHTAGVNAEGAALEGAATVNLEAGIVMGIASVAGVVAHQLVTAGGLRTPADRQHARADRTAARLARREAGKVAAARRAAIRSAVAEIDQHGAARLVVVPGRYTLNRHRITRRPRLAPAVRAGLPVDPPPDAELRDTLAAEIGAWLTTQPHPDPTPTRHPAAQDRVGDEPEAAQGPDDRSDKPPTSGAGVATLDRPNPTPPRPTVPPPTDRPAPRPEPPSEPRSGRKSTHESGPESGRKPRPQSGRASGRVASRGRPTPPAGRSMDQLRAQLQAALAQEAVNPSSAESIRTTLRCSAARARQLRDEHHRNPGPDAGAPSGGDRR